METFAHMKRFAKTLACVSLGLTAWLCAEWYFSRGKLPPTAVNNLTEYLAWAPHADRFVRLPDDRLLALGPTVGLMPSGPAAHVFDDSGALRDSSADVGDDPDFNERWKISYPLQIEGRSIAERRTR